MARDSVEQLMEAPETDDGCPRCDSPLEPIIGDRYRCTGGNCGLVLMRVGQDEHRSGAIVTRHKIKLGNRQRPDARSQEEEEK